ncbi:hypothetical protein P3T76_013398 [Phytophthora citrophthora]|uniref:Uncharacterized protein n=1 Tax=Phytophthora citrophthora TaxID=4793 RepID=A0AAD9LDG0_9STRA|nr:hypothetical protein P3T76_013398 [Phytophthora citrophthora]
MGLVRTVQCSIALKLMLQELAKYMMTVIRRPVSRRVMVALVSTPTIIVDTQVRILLLRQSNLNVSVAGTVFIAFFEIAVRATKSTLVQRHTREPTRSKASRRRSSSVYSRPDLTQIKPMQIVPVFSNGRNEIAAQQRLTSTGETPAQFKARRDAMERRHKIRVLHVGEIYADMYAEYIAIGCSFVMLFFFRNHPQYEFCRLLSKVSGHPAPLQIQKVIFVISNW